MSRIFFLIFNLLLLASVSFGLFIWGLEMVANSVTVTEFCTGSFIATLGIGLLLWGGEAAISYFTPLD